MTKLRAAALLLASALAAAGCGCLTFESGRLTIRTDCASETPEEELLDFAIAPGVVDPEELVGELPGGLAELLTGACEIETPKEKKSLSCEQLGFGSTEGGQAALLCGPKMQVGGLIGTDTFYVCTAEKAFGDDGLWPMSCKYFGADGTEKEGPRGTECKAVGSLELVAGT